MSLPLLPPTAPGEALLVGTSYENGTARWGALPNEIGGRREGGVITLGDGGVRLRLVEDPAWDFIHGGHIPALVPDGDHVPPVAVLADIPVVHGGDGPLLVDLAGIPGRGARVPSERLGEILSAVLGGELAFDDLVRGMDARGMYQGDYGRPAFPTPTSPVRPSFPSLPSTDGTLLVRTSFDDEEGWRALLDELGGTDEDGWVGTDLDFDEIDVEHYPLTALVVDDRAFEGLLPAQVPALVPPDEHTTLVALADARTFTEPGRPLTAVDLYDTPGHCAVLPCRDIGSMACNLEIANMDFQDFVAQEGVRPWWEG
ncbi:DUF6924 domain-containing protein [Streptantibioticus cattleyicolor]|uniref:DUF6924 domain-containing protein n=1 Tax=Streptantibioticus cattleyicolor (strain ATCC 35852 / DSM 46488 / JCM 4925 / NBRC 14057 / NRRL 8057) TaxID=1003195 RepID=F8JKW3_STREN|nr:hypothetical protein [Streptantibioticus cattleyicolor]AEW99682.1 hypothetical protein SCATT_p14890 [Streptantibioticus cattleyicolor NRRL 8057 = DSM 46488]CCB71280.1 protein of unknown function [Streptantibioticus cattleyicolor NRRL 8057 = DSM 46488]